MNTSAIVGKVVEFTTQKDAASHGVVLGVVDMLHNNNSHVVTGYLIQDTLGKLHHVVYWRLSKVMESPSEKQASDKSKWVGLGPGGHPIPSMTAGHSFATTTNFREEEVDDLPF